MGSDTMVSKSPPSLFTGNMTYPWLAGSPADNRTHLCYPDPRREAALTPEESGQHPNAESSGLTTEQETQYGF